MKSHIVSAENYLLIDISNSFTKVALATQRRISKPKRIETRKFTAAVLRRFLRRRKSQLPQGSGGQVDIVVVCSVVPKKNAVVWAVAKGSKILRLTPRIKLGVGIDYPNPKTIGADRLANAVAVAALYGSPAIVVDFGTAVTFDIISAQRKYIGGVIAPGLESAHSITPEAFFKRAAFGRWKIDDRSDARRRSDRLSRLGARNHSAGQSRAFSSEEAARDRYRRVRGFDCGRPAGNRHRSSEFDLGGLANHCESKLLIFRISQRKGRFSPRRRLPAKGLEFRRKGVKFGLSLIAQKSFMWGRP